MASDEAIVAVIGHEMFEFEMLRSVFADGCNYREVGGRFQHDKRRGCRSASWGLRGWIGQRHMRGEGEIIKRLIEMYESGCRSRLPGNDGLPSDARPG